MKAFFEFPLRTMLTGIPLIVPLALFLVLL